MTVHSELKRLAEAATPQNFDTAEEKSGNGYIECPHCGGSGEVELEADYCNYDGAAIGVQFYGIGHEFGAAEAYYRAANPAAVLELIAENEALSRWRDLALQFDNHRMAALWHLKRLLVEPQWQNVAELFLGEPPLAAHEVVAERDQLKADNERLARNRDMWKGQVERQAEELASLRKRIDDMSPFKGAPLLGPDTKCLACGGYHYGMGGLPCPKMTPVALAFSRENQRLVPVEPLRVPHPLDAAMGKGEQP